MPDTETRTSSPVETERAVRLLNRSLRRLRVRPVDRRTITNDVRGDLNAAAAQGVDPVDLLRPDVDAFARSAMEANGVQPMVDDYRRLLIGSALAAAVGVPAAYLLFSYVVHPLFVNWFELDGRYPTAGPVLALAVMVLLGTAVVLAALYAMLAGRPARNETVLRAGLLVPVGGGAGVAAAIAVMDRPGFTLSDASITTQMVPAGAVPVLLALAAARWWGRRSAADGPDDD